MKISKEARIGIIVIASIALLFWGLNYLKGKDFFTNQKTVFAIYDRVDGLSQSNSVQVNGMKVGMVSGLKLLPDQSGRIIVSMNLSNEIRIPNNSTAEIFGTDLLGTKGIRFEFGNSTETLEDGDTVASAIQKSLTEEVNAQVAPIKHKAENLLSSMDSVLLIIRTVFNEKTKNNLKNSFESISNSLASIEHITGNLDTVLSKEGRMQVIFENLESITSNFRSNNEKITHIIENFASISDSVAKANVAQTLDHLRMTLDQTSQLMAKVNRGEGTLGQLANNDSLYKNLNSTSHELDLLLKDFRLNPNRYVNISLINFGRRK